MKTSIINNWRKFAAAGCLSIGLMACSGQTDMARNDQGCINNSQRNPDMECTMAYKPVCGCNGVTYSNQCSAVREGVTSYAWGECARQNDQSHD